MQDFIFYPAIQGNLTKNTGNFYSVKYTGTLAELLSSSHLSDNFYNKDILHVNTSDVTGIYTYNSNTSSLDILLDIDTGATKQLVKNTASVTTFLNSGDLTASSIVLAPNSTYDVFDQLAGSFTESLKICTGATPLDVNSNPFTGFIDTTNKKLMFPDIDTTTNGIIDVSELNISCRISGTFSGNAAAVIKCTFYSLDNTGALNEEIGTLDFNRQFTIAFNLSTRAIVSRLSKTNSSLVDYGAKFILSSPADNSVNFTLTQMNFLITCGS